MRYSLTLKVRFPRKFDNILHQKRNFKSHLLDPADVRLFDVTAYKIFRQNSLQNDQILSVNYTQLIFITEEYRIFRDCSPFKN